MSRFKSRRASRSSGSLPLLSKTTISVASVDAGGGAHFRLGGLALDFGINPNLGVVAEAHLAKLIQSAINSPISDLLVSHFHWDHHGGVLPVLKAYLAQGIRLPRLVCTGITWGLLKPHLAMNGFLPDGPKEDPRSVQQAVRTEKITLIPNEHSVPGSVGASVQLANGKRIFYTGDFRRLDLPLRFSSPDLCILDCTGALKMEPTEEKEERIRENIMVLAKETLESPDASVYVSTFSTQLERICELERRCKKSTKHWPSLAGTSLLINTGAYREPLYGQRTERFVICSGVWAQPGSKLVRMSEERDMDYRLKRGDRVILAGSMPTWNRVLMPNITAMCERLTWMGVEVIVDSSLDLAHMPLLRRAEVHCSGHASFLEIVAFLQQLRPKSVFATHGSMEARRVVERYCRSQGIAVVSMNSSSEITC